jgi:hypothetical protein
MCTHTVIVRHVLLRFLIVYQHYIMYTLVSDSGPPPKCEDLCAALQYLLFHVSVTVREIDPFFFVLRLCWGEVSKNKTDV